MAEIETFWVAADSEELNDLQRDGATAVIDLAAEFEAGKGLENSDLRARVIGRMSDIQVRDFALGSHNEESAQWYWKMWRELLVSAPPGFVAPIASVFAALAYECGDGELAHKALDRALADDVRLLTQPLDPDAHALPSERPAASRSRPMTNEHRVGLNPNRLESLRRLQTKPTL